MLKRGQPVNAMTSEILDAVSNKKDWWDWSSESGWALDNLAADLLPPYVSQKWGGLTLQQASPVKNSKPLPFIGHQLSQEETELIKKYQELRFWFFSDQIATGKEDYPFYLQVELLNQDETLTWKRWLPIHQPNCWELQQLWLGDMANELRTSVAKIRISLGNSTAPLSDQWVRNLKFKAKMGDLLAVTPHPVQDVEKSFFERLQKHHSNVIWELPENNTSKSFPSIVIIPWSVQPRGELGGSVDIVDNYGPKGAYSRPIPKRLQLEYAIEVTAQKRTAKATLLDAIVEDFTRTSYFVIDGQPISLLPFVPSPEQLAESMSPGRSSLFFQVTVPIEAGSRQFQPSVDTTRLVTEHPENRALNLEHKETVQL